METTSTYKWLWLEDEPNSVNDLEMIFRKKNIPFEKFQNTNSLFEKLIEIKRSGRLTEYGLIIDIMLTGTPIIMVPPEWKETNNNGIEKYEYHKTSERIAGIVFYEKVILDAGKDFWNPSPPVIFLTSMYDDNTVLDRVETIKVLYAANGPAGHSPNDSNVKYIRKWEIDEKMTYSLFNDWK